MNENSIFAIYSRKSKYTGKGESIETQIELCRQYINAHFGEKAAENILVYEDEGFSGGNLARPEFKRMMADAQSGKFSAIVVYRLDRISRSVGDFSQLIETLNEMRISFISIREQFDTSSPMGRAMMYIASVFSQLERETIAERIRDNMQELAKTGRWLGGNTPTGYCSESMEKVTIDDKVKRAYKLKLVPEEADIIELIFKTFIETKSLTKTDAFLLRNGIKTKKGNNFTRFAIKTILMNPVYMIADEDAYLYWSQHSDALFSDKSEFDGKRGIMAYNRTIQRPGKAIKYRPISEWIISVGFHPGIVPGATWILAQELLTRNRSKQFRKPRSNVALLSGLLVCGNCGDYMRPKLTKRTNSNGEFIYTYMCSTKERSTSTRCNIKNLNGNTLDKVIIEEIKKLPRDDSDFLVQLSKTHKAIEESARSYETCLESLKKELSQCTKEMDVYLKTLTIAEGEAAGKHIIDKINELDKRLQSIRVRIDEMTQLAQSHALSQMEFDLIKDLLARFQVTIDDMSVEEKRSILRTFIKRIVWDGKRISLFLFGSDDGIRPDAPFHTNNGFNKSTKIEPNKEKVFDTSADVPLCEHSIFNTP
ncbi:MAG TPA: recombinase family protein [Clostridiales bacterium]|nr:recombinase family protein [Clostridiales bacterium]